MIPSFSGLCAVIHCRWLENWSTKNMYLALTVTLWAPACCDEESLSLPPGCKLDPKALISDPAKPILFRFESRCSFGCLATLWRHWPPQIIRSTRQLKGFFGNLWLQTNDLLTEPSVVEFQSVFSAWVPIKLCRSASWSAVTKKKTLRQTSADVSLDPWLGVSPTAVRVNRVASLDKVIFHPTSETLHKKEASRQNSNCWVITSCSNLRGVAVQES